MSDRRLRELERDAHLGGELERSKLYAARLRKAPGVCPKCEDGGYRLCPTGCCCGECFVESSRRTNDLLWCGDCPVRGGW